MKQIHNLVRPVALLLTLSLLAACNGQVAAPLAVAPAQTLAQAVAQNQPSANVQTEVLETIQNEVIVKYRSGFTTQAASRPRPSGTEVLDAFNTSDESTQLHRLPKNVGLEKALETYTNDPGVEFAIPNVRFQVQMSLVEKVKRWFKGETPSPAPTTNPATKPTPAPSASAPTTSPSPTTVKAQSAIDVQDPLGNQQWYLSQMGMSQVWGDYGTGSSGITVAVLDTGVDYTHPDLEGKIIKGPDYVDKDYDPKDMHGHGTHVAGIIAAGLNNSQGIAGLAPQTRVLAIRVLDEKGSGSLFNIAKGIAYAANNGAQVINLSLGSPPGGGAMKTLANFLASYAERKGSLIIAAAGNSGSAIGYPAAASKFLAVGAINEDSYLASFSNRGPELDIVAPGVNIMSTFPTYPVTANESGLPQNYASLNGTSMATPMVSALAAMILSKNPYLKPTQLRERLEATATDLGSIGRDDMFGAGVINPAKALQ